MGETKNRIDLCSTYFSRSLGRIVSSVQGVAEGHGWKMSYHASGTSICWVLNNVMRKVEEFALRRSVSGLIRNMRERDGQSSQRER